MRVLNKSRKKLQPGDIFVFQMPDDFYRYGRVIRTDAIGGGFPDCNLIYLYAVATSTKLPVPALSTGSLLIPPELTNTLPWVRGYFENIEHRPLLKNDTLLVHCFWDDPFERYVDEYRNVLDRRHEPCGFYGLASYAGIDQAVSKALDFLWTRPELKNLSPNFASFYKKRLVALEQEGMTYGKAELKAMQETVVKMGDRVEDYAWRELDRCEEWRCK